MSEAFYHSVALILIIAGSFSLLSRLYTLLLCRRNCKGVFTVIAFYEDEASLADKVYTACCLSKYRVLGERKIYVIDKGISPYTKRHCREIISGMGQVYFIKEDKLAEIMIESSEVL